MVNIAPTEIKVRTEGSAEFLCSATGVGSNDFIYQWFLNTLPVADQETSTLVINIVTEDNTGDYTCSVRNSFGNIGRSEVARLILGRFEMSTVYSVLLII